MMVGDSYLLMLECEAAWVQSYGISASLNLTVIPNPKPYHTATGAVSYVEQVSSLGMESTTRVSHNDRQANRSGSCSQIRAEECRGECQGAAGIGQLPADSGTQIFCFPASGQTLVVAGIFLLVLFCTLCFTLKSTGSGICFPQERGRDVLQTKVVKSDGMLKLAIS